MNSVDNIIKFVLILSTVICLYTIGKIAYFYFITIKKWKKAEGIIIDSDVQYFRSRQDSDTEGWNEVANYKYTVDSIEYEGNCISKNLGMLYSLKYQAKQNNLRKGQKILVTFNPMNPEQSVIDDKFDLLNIVIPGIVLGVGYYCFF